MSQKYYAIVTSLGAAKIANAAALGTKLNITQMAVGDGGGTLPTPNASQMKLVNEKRRAAINTLSVDPANASQVIAEQVIPETEGGFWIREMGLFDADGTLIAVCNTPETYKPALQEGSGRTQTVRMILIVNSTDAITLKIDPSVVLATRQYVDDKAIEVKQYADSLMAAHLKAADPHTQYAQKESPTLTGTPKAPTAEAGNSSRQLATTEFVAKEVSALGIKDGSGLFGLGIRNEKLPGKMGALDVTRFDYFPPGEKIGPLSGLWCGGITHVMGDDIGWQIAGQGLGGDGGKPRAFIRMALAGKKLSEWGELYHTLNKPTAQDIGALPAEGKAVSAGSADSATKLETARKIAGVAFDGSKDIELTADNVGAVPAGGGNFDKIFRFRQVETIAKESNPVQLVSAVTGQSADTFVAWSSYTWYSDYVRTGIVRAGDKTVKSFAVEINGIRFLEIGRDGTFLNGNMANDLRLGQQESMSVTIPASGQSTDSLVPHGCYVTGVTATSTGSYVGITRIFYRRLQKRVGANWIDASYL